MKRIPLIISLAFLVIISTLNVALLYDNYADCGITTIFSLMISLVGIIPALVLLFFRSGIKWVGITKTLGVITMATPIIIEEQRIISSMLHREIYFYSNLILIPLSIASIIAIHRKSLLKIKP